MTIRNLPDKTRLIQLAEEASELSQACLKLVRVMDGDSPAPEQAVRDNLIEEIQAVVDGDKATQGLKDAFAKFIETKDKT